MKRTAAYQQSDSLRDFSSLNSWPARQLGTLDLQSNQNFILDWVNMRKYRIMRRRSETLFALICVIRMHELIILECFHF